MESVLKSLKWPFEVRVKNMASPTQLPPELWDHIMSFLNELPPSQRSRTLSSCALVCRSWTALAQAHLFKVVLFLTSRPSTELAQLLIAQPRIASHIRCLTIQGYSRHETNSDVNEGLADFVEHIAPHLSFLQELRLVRFHSSNLKEAVLASIAVACPTVSRLSLTQLELDRNCTKAFIAFFHALHHLQRLELHSSSHQGRLSNAGGTMTTGDDASCSNPLNFRHLVVDDRNAQFALEILSKHHSTSLPRTLALKLMGQMVFPQRLDVSGLLRQLGPSLDNLHLTIDHIGPLSVVPYDTRPFAAINGLRTLTFRVPRYIQSTFVPSLLSEMASPTLELVSFELQLGFIDDNFERWTKIAEILISPPFDTGSLRAVIFRFRKGELTSSLEEELRARLRSLDERILVFEHCDASHF